MQWQSTWQYPVHISKAINNFPGYHFTNPKQEETLTVEPWHTEPGCSAPNQFQAFGGKQIMTIGIFFWLCAGVVSIAMMQTIFKLLLKNSDGKH
jgi:hypothetical protein